MQEGIVRQVLWPDRPVRGSFWVSHLAACGKFRSLPGSCTGSTGCSGSGGKQHPVYSTSMSQKRARDLLSLGCFPPSTFAGCCTVRTQRPLTGIYRRP